MSLLLLDTTFLVDSERGDIDLDEVIGDDDDVAIAAVSGPPESSSSRVNRSLGSRYW